MTKILVTGASGFIGSALCKELEAAGHEVWKSMRYVSGGRFGYYEQEHTVFFDLRDAKETEAAILTVNPEVIFHLAAQSAVAYSFPHPIEVFNVVANGTVHVAEAARKTGAWLIHASTSEVYGRIEEHTFPLTEDQRTGGTSPYAAAKCAAEEYLRVLKYAYKFPVTIVRPFNTMGRSFLNNRQFVVERTVTQAIEEGVISLSDPTPLRDFVFRTDHVGAYLAVLTHRAQAVGETFNICTGDAWEIRRMAEYVARAVGTRMNKLVVVSWNRGPDRPWDIPRLQGSNEKAKKLLAWQPKYTIATALDKVVDEWLSVLRK